MKPKATHLVLPVRDLRTLVGLAPGDTVLVSGELYVFRDQAHRRIAAGERGALAGRDLTGAGVYYCAPSPAKNTLPVGACGPTSSYRMDSLTEPVLRLGFRVMIGKGHRSASIATLCRRYRAVYLITWGGCGALLARQVRSVRIVAFPDLVTEAVSMFTVEDFPAVVGIDAHGRILEVRTRTVCARPNRQKNRRAAIHE